MRRRLILAFGFLALTVTSCGGGVVDHSFLMCRGTFEEFPTSVVLALQAVPTAEYIPCVDQLPIGWEVEAVEPRTGLAGLTIASPSLGQPFAEVTVRSSCEPGDAVRTQGSESGTRYWVDLDEVVDSVPVQVLPVAARHLAYAERAVAELSTRSANGLRLDVVAAPSPEPMADRIAAAHAAGAVVLIVDDADVYAGTASLRNPDGTEVVGLDAEQIVAEIAKTAPDPTYRGTWYYTFVGGCVVMEIDAEGPEAGLVDEEIPESIDIVRTWELRNYLRASGYESVG